MTDQTPICDYEGSNYRTDFWEGRGRNYEDQIERGVLQRLLPTSGKRLLEIGAGFGRITNEYRNFEHVVLLDYSFSQLQYAREQLGDEGYTYVAADAYKLPFRTGTFDAATMIRVIHHFSDVPQVLNGIHRVLANEACFLLEFANKRNLKAMLRYTAKQQEWSPYTLDPVEFVELNFDFHPRYIANELQAANFKTVERVPVSWLRLNILKQRVPTNLLLSVDRAMQNTRWLASPSIFTKNIVHHAAQPSITPDLAESFVCPQTGTDLQREGNFMVSEAGLRYEIRDGIYDFKQAVE